jgi:hypothetical protein
VFFTKIILIQHAIGARVGGQGGVVSVVALELMQRKHQTNSTARLRRISKANTRIPAAQFGYFLGDIARKIPKLRRR